RASRRRSSPRRGALRSRWTARTTSGSAGSSTSTGSPPPHPSRVRPARAHSKDPGVSHNRRHPGLTALVATTIALLLVAVSLIVGRVTAPVDAAPGTRSAEAGFARDMQMHHDQAVE